MGHRLQTAPHGRRVRNRNISSDLVWREPSSRGSRGPRRTFRACAVGIRFAVRRAPGTRHGYRSSLHGQPRKSAPKYAKRRATGPPFRFRQKNRIPLARG